MNLHQLGFDNWFQEKLQNYDRNELNVARITAVNRDNYLIRNEKDEITAEVTGKMMFSAESNEDLPAVGDWVLVEYFDNHSHAIIHAILPRKSLLKRKIAGKKIDFQVIAANIDTAFIMQSLDSNFNLRRLERYLVMINESHIDPIILLSKSDLISTDELSAKISEIKIKTGDYKVMSFSSMIKTGLNEISEQIKSGSTYCLLGSSGVGKTTLLNLLLGSDEFFTREVRKKDNRGRHATARRQLIVLQNGGMVIDTPGMRELGNFGVETGIDETFDDILSLTKLCRFRNCTHTNETGCAVLAAVEKQELDAGRYNSYIKLRKESEYYEMSYYEKRKRDKQFGKMCKEVMKHKEKKGK